MTDHPNLGTALAAFQAEIPHIGKGNTAQVRSDKGNYSYKYADLSDVVAKVMPVLAKHGLSFSAKPTLNEDGKFVLEYTLRHSGGESDTGCYPLGSGTPQQIGSAITYGRRYCLCAVTGVAPDEDDDGAAAASGQVYEEPSRPARAQAPAQRRQEPTGDQVATAAADLAKAQLRKSCSENGWDMVIVADLFAGEHQAELKETTNADLIEKFRQSLFSVPREQLVAAS